MHRAALWWMCWGLCACAFSPEEQAARAYAREMRAQQWAVAMAARCDQETARLMALQFGAWAGASAEERARFAERFADPLFQSCWRLAKENDRLEQELQALEDLEWRREMYREAEAGWRVPLLHAYPWRRR